MEEVGESARALIQHVANTAGRDWLAMKMNDDMDHLGIAVADLVDEMPLTELLATWAQLGCPDPEGTEIGASEALRVAVKQTLAAAVITELQRRLEWKCG